MTAIVPESDVRQTVIARRILLTGRVQGLGVRPTIHRLAVALSLSGVVRNTSRGVEIEIEGAPADVHQFARRIQREAPPGAAITSLHLEECIPRGFSTFVIEPAPAAGPLATAAPQDVATCSQCLDEIFDPLNRRFEYPFTSCTSCGPRYSIIRDMPYERAETTMSRFPLCPTCLAEYTEPGDRRFHAQTNACGCCGPQVWCVEKRGETAADGSDAIRLAVGRLREGKIVAIKGLGGYQLLVEATNEPAVSRLRERKRRRAKPLAVMVESLDQAERYAALDPVERRTLCEASNSIVLVRAKSPTPLAASIHPGVDTLGLLLPTTPLHHLILRSQGGPVVCTSGNREGEPLEYDNDQAEDRLANICDLWLHHNRPIERPIDDSVVRVIAGRPVTLRLARGLAPLPLAIPATTPTLAVGGHMKSAAAWSTGEAAVLGPHLGDLDTLAARERYGEQIEGWRRLYRFTPQRIVHDAHPDYDTTRYALQESLPRRAVQHHHAHVVAGMIEHGWLDRTVLGVAWDGTGYGAGGQIWGGEFLVATTRSYERLAHLRPMALPGGEKAIRQPWRLAVALLRDALGDECFQEGRRSTGRHSAAIVLDSIPCGETSRLQQCLQILDHPRFSPRTTSAGRLFDGVAAIVLGLSETDYDGQPAMMLEAAADPSAEGQYTLPLSIPSPWQLDWRPLVRDLIDDQRGGATPGEMAMRFHRGLAEGVVEVCRRRLDLPVVLCGGVFQNRLLVELIVERIARGRPQHEVGTPGVIPPGDGGLAAGQLAIALAKGGVSCV